MAEKIATRHAYGEALAEIGSDPKIVALDADVSSCTMSCMFAQKYPERFFNMGIAEANMIGAAARSVHVRFYAVRPCVCHVYGGARL